MDDSEMTSDSDFFDKYGTGGIAYFALSAAGVASQLTRITERYPAAPSYVLTSAHAAVLRQINRGQRISAGELRLDDAVNNPIVTSRLSAGEYVMRTQVVYGGEEEDTEWIRRVNIKFFSGVTIEELEDIIQATLKKDDTPRPPVGGDPIVKSMQVITVERGR